MPPSRTTSIPDWALDPTDLPGTTPLPAGAASWLLIAVGGSGRERAAAWCRDLPDDVPVALLDADRVADLVPTLDAAVAQARVGVRVAVAGPVGDCLAARGRLVSAGLEDDELLVSPTEPGAVEVFCVHCRAATVTTAAVGEVVPCDCCGLGLLVYHHVSRRDGRYLGFQADAETLPPGAPAGTPRTDSTRTRQDDQEGGPR